MYLAMRSTGMRDGGAALTMRALWQRVQDMSTVSSDGRNLPCFLYGRMEFRAVPGHWQECKRSTERAAAYSQGRLAAIFTPTLPGIDPHNAICVSGLSPRMGLYSPMS